MFGTTLLPGFGRVRTFFTGVGPRAFSNGINSAIFSVFLRSFRSSLRKWEDSRKTLTTAALGSGTMARREIRSVLSKTRVTHKCAANVDESSENHAADN